MFSSTPIRLRWALVGAATAALIVATTALGGSGVGAVFNLGQTNSVNGTSTLTGTTAGAQLGVVNASSASTGAGIRGQSASAIGAGVLGVNLAGGPGLQATVKAGTPPLKVNSSGLVANLNASLLGGHAFSYFLPATGTAANASKLGGKLPGAYWQVGGNAPGATGVLGTTDNQALELKVNGARALRLEPDATSPNVIGGYSGNGNPSGSGAAGMTIGGGGTTGNNNQATDNYDTVGGGAGNVAGNLDASPANADHATVAGGFLNGANGISSTVGGGAGNTASGNLSVVAGGLQNLASGTPDATVAGGEVNTASGGDSAVLGGEGNVASGGYSTVAGGDGNTASGNFSFAAGRRAKATDLGSFVWGDSTNADINSQGPNTFTVRASGGTYVKGNVNVQDGSLSTGAVAWSSGDTSPSISGGNVFITQNGGSPTTITNFTGSSTGQTITILFGDSDTTIQHSGTILLKGGVDFTGSTNDTLTLLAISGTFYEVSRSVNH